MSPTDPLSPGLGSGRIDMGVDYTGSGPLYALDDGTITSISNSGWPGGTFIGLHLDTPVDGQSYIYYAENIAPNVNIGQRVKAGQTIGFARGTSPFIEIGFAAPPGTGQTMADSTGQDKAGLAKGDAGFYSTGYGVAMSNLIASLGGKAGVQQPGGIQGSGPSGTPVSASPGTANANPATANTLSSVSGGCFPAATLMIIALPLLPLIIPILVMRHALSNRKHRRRPVPRSERANRESTC